MPNEEVANVAMDWVEKMETSIDAHLLKPELDAWLGSDARHPGAYKAAQMQWMCIQKAVSSLKKGSLSHEALIRKIEKTRVDRRRRRVVKQVVAYGAAVAILSVCAGIWMNSAGIPSAPDGWTLYSGVSGVPAKHVLKDGSELLVRHDAKVRFRMDSKEREVDLDGGELLVHVKHDSNRAFTVRAGDNILQAKGTEFDVRFDDTGELIATVREGKIAVGHSENSTSTKISGAVATISAGHVATISHGKVQIEAKEPDEIDNQLAWTHGKLYLHGTLSEAVAQFNEQNAIKLAILDPYIGNVPVSGLFGAHDVREFAESLQPKGVQYQVKKSADFKSDTFILSAKKKQSPKNSKGNEA